jgi:hypothetical protein
MRTLFAIIIVLPLATPFAIADAHGACDSKGQPALGVVSIAGVAYIDDRNYLFGNGVWLYFETNGEPGLQRGGGSWIVPNDNEICYDDSPNGPDGFWF